jgi:hypothetical protein
MRMKPSSGNFDWIDALLVAAGCTIAIAVVVASSQRLALLLISVPLTLRRVMVGPPQLPEPRRGTLWSLVSIFGLLALILGVGLFVLASWVVAERIARDRNWWSAFEPVAGGLVAVLVGALCLRARYPRVQPRIPPARVT